MTDGSHHDPDLLLDVSELRVESISLEVEDLQARVALQADVLDLLKLHVGVEASLGRVQLEIKGVEAQLLLKARLDNVARIVDRVLKTIDDNPEIIERLVDRAGAAVEHIGAGAEELSEGVGSAVESLGDGPEDHRPRLAQDAKPRRRTRPARDRR